MPKVEFHSDAVMEPWRNAIGGLIVNFGVLEFLTYEWIICFQRDDLMQEVAADMEGLGDRLKLVLRLIDRETELDAEKRAEAKKAWKRVAKLSEMRNTIAHNPITYWWTGEEDRSRPPDVVSVPDLRKAVKGTPQKGKQLTSLDELRKAVLETRELGLRLKALVEELGGELHGSWSSATGA